MDAHGTLFQFNMNHTSALFAAAGHHLLLVAKHQGHRGIQRQGHEGHADHHGHGGHSVHLGRLLRLRAGAHLPPPPIRRNLHFSDDALGFLKGTNVPILGLFGILMAFGHSVLAMSGEESLAQVNREIEHPKLKNLKRAAIVIAIYSLVFTGGATLLASMLIPTARTHIYQDNLIAGLAMYMVGPMFWRSAFASSSCWSASSFFPAPSTPP